MVSMF